MPRVNDIAQKLSMARHEAYVEDLLHESPPRMRLMMCPWRGPTSDAHSQEWGHFELSVEETPEERVVGRFWLDSSDEVPSKQTSVPAARLGAAWLRSRLLEFIEEMLDRA